jgi:hypothetical protein
LFRVRLSAGPERPSIPERICPSESHSTFLFVLVSCNKTFFALCDNIPTARGLSPTCGGTQKQRRKSWHGRTESTRHAQTTT